MLYGVQLDASVEERAGELERSQRDEAEGSERRLVAEAVDDGLDFGRDEGSRAAGGVRRGGHGEERSDELGRRAEGGVGQGSSADNEISGELTRAGEKV